MHYPESALQSMFGREMISCQVLCCLVWRPCFKTHHVFPFDKHKRCSLTDWVIRIGAAYLDCDIVLMKRGEHNGVA